MSIKSLFDKDRLAPARGLEKKSLSDLTQEVESEAMVKSVSVTKETFTPEIDFSDPKNFVRYGLAGEYYSNALKRIYQQYPYDGTLEEKKTFYNNLTPLEKWFYDNEYPKTNGHAIIGNTWDSAANESALLFGETNTQEYISIIGGPNLNNVYDLPTDRGKNLRFDAKKGNTIEFWMKKEGFVSASGRSTREVVFDLWNSQSLSDSRYGRLTVYLDSRDAHKHKVFCQFSSGSTTSSAELGTGLSTIADNKWHHYAVVLASGSNDLQTTLYTDGAQSDIALSTSGNMSYVSGAIQANLGALRTTFTGDDISEIGWGKLSASIDEFRYWKTSRTPKQIGRNYFVPVGGGTNNNTANKDLGVYYKFNEGITGTGSKDSAVLDYSGRITNGTWVGYSTTVSRSTASAIVGSGKFATEEKDPIIYSNHLDVQQLRNKYTTIAAEHDNENTVSLYNSIPAWAREEDEEGSTELQKLLQIMGSYFDTVHSQIESVKDTKEPSYVSSSMTPSIHNRRLLTSLGFDVSDIFVQTEIIESLLSRDENQVYEKDINEVKNLIYKNIYNNLIFINKSKGTEKSFRNLFRCFGIDHNLVKLNLYGDNSTFLIDDTYENVSIPTTTIDFSGLKVPTHQKASIYQYASSSHDVGFISSSEDLNYALTAEAEVLFPLIPDISTLSSSVSPTSSLFGCHTATGALDGTFLQEGADPDRGFQVYAIKPSTDNTYFMLKSSTGYLPTLTSSVYEDVYDNSKWNFAVRLKANDFAYSVATTASLSASYEFYGVNMNSGEVVNEFSLTASLTSSIAELFMTGTNKRFYIGADRRDFTGSLQYRSDVRFSSFRYWQDYLTDSEIRHHARNPNNYGRERPLENATIFSLSASNSENLPRIETLALNWDFSTLSGSDNLGFLSVLDASSGSTALRDRYLHNNIGHVIKNNHTGLGEFFLPNTEVISIEHINASRLVSPENLQSSDLVNILSKDDDTFVRDSRPTKYFFSIEMSMYEIISREMLNFFASVVEFNNYIGEPKYMYRSNYKDLEKLRNLFFEKVGAKPDLQKFVSLYKWFDSALDVIIANMIPLSATVYDKVRTVVESHVLERNKYRHKYSSIKEFQVGEDKDVLFNTDNVQTSFDSTVTSIPKDPVGSSINLDKTPPVGDGF
tara:strand:- start:5622 stop:9062 length:3441 start_codon:yes stop_codon:yes gene_type:complete